MDNEYLKIAVCPKCGHDVVKTCKGYSCLGNTGAVPSCDFFLPAVVCNRRISDCEAMELISGSTLIMDGFSTNEGRVFSSTLHLDGDGKTVVESRVSTCPLCGGAIHVGTRAFNCANHSADPKCPFVVWRSYGGYVLDIADVVAICEHGVTDCDADMYRTDGTRYSKRLGLTPEKDKVIVI